MIILPKIKECPHCSAINVLRINGINYENNFQNFVNWNLKKIFNCRKCKVKLGLFINSFNKKEEKLIWIALLKCEDSHLKKLDKLQKSKMRYAENNRKKEFLRTIKEIQNIQNQIRLDQIKLKIKTKIQNRGMASA